MKIKRIFSLFLSLLLCLTLFSAPSKTVKAASNYTYKMGNFIDEDYISSETGSFKSFASWTLLSAYQDGSGDLTLDINVSNEQEHNTIRFKDRNWNSLLTEAERSRIKHIEICTSNCSDCIDEIFDDGRNSIDVDNLESLSIHYNEEKGGVDVRNNHAWGINCDAFRNKLIEIKVIVNCETCAEIKLGYPMSAISEAYSRNTGDYAWVDNVSHHVSSDGRGFSYTKGSKTLNVSYRPYKERQVTYIIDDTHEDTVEHNARDYYYDSQGNGTESELDKTFTNAAYKVWDKYYPQDNLNVKTVIDPTTGKNYTNVSSFFDVDLDCNLLTITLEKATSTRPFYLIAFENSSTSLTHTKLSSSSQWYSWDRLNNVGVSAREDKSTLRQGAIWTTYSKRSLADGDNPINLAKGISVNAGYELKSITQYDLVNNKWADIPLVDNQLPAGTAGTQYINLNITPVEYAINYRLDGGKNNSENPTYWTVENTGNKKIVFKNPTKKGYQFNGWYDSNNNKVTEFSYTTGKALEPFTLIADWTEVDCTHERFDNGVVTKEATCNETGIKTYTCLDCGYERTEVIPKDKSKHIWDAGVVTKDSTTTELGVKTYTCTVCGDTKTEDIPKKEAPITVPEIPSNITETDSNLKNINKSDLDSLLSSINTILNKSSYSNTELQDVITKLNSFTSKANGLNSTQVLNECENTITKSTDSSVVIETLKGINSVITNLKTKVEKLETDSGKTDNPSSGSSTTEPAKPSTPSTEQPKTTQPVKEVETVNKPASGQDANVTITSDTVSYEFTGKDKTKYKVVKENGGYVVYTKVNNTWVKVPTKETDSTDKVASITTNKTTGKKTVVIKVAKPKKVTLKSVKAIGRKKLVVKIKKQKMVKGYEVSVSTSKKFTKKTTKTRTTNKLNYTFMGLKDKKTYYVRVRSFKLVNSERVYGAWSKVKKAKVYY